MTIAGVDQFSGSSAPHDVDLIFTATGPTETVAFSQFSSEFPAITDPRRLGRLNSRTVDLGDARLGFAALAFAHFRRTRRSMVCHRAILEA